MHGRHRKPSSSSVIAARAAVITGTAAAAVLVSTGAASAASTPTNVIPCTGYPIDSVTKSLTMDYCGGGPAITR